MSFENVQPPLAQALTERGYTELTPVQSAVIAPDVAGRDLIVSAQTGSGKTVAFGLALADELLAELGSLPMVERPLALVIAPTRELALQVSRELGWLYGQHGVRIATCVGGMDASKERRNLRAGPAIVVGTPGRLRDHLERGALDLSGLIGVVLDEADEMLDMGFRDDLEEILDATPDKRRTLLFSATMPPAIVRLAERYQTDAERLSLAGKDRGHGDIAYQAIAVSPSEVENAVVNLLRFHEAETAILFCATRDSVRRLHATLQERGFGVVALSGEHSQSERNQALQALRDRRARVCVATDVAARGIDLPTLSLVIHVEIPRDAETLQHRSGRTGRAGKKGTAALVVPYNRRRRVEGMLRGAQIEAEWLDAPTPEAIRAKGGEALVVPAHIGNTEDLQNLVDQTIAKWGRIDVLVPNAAINPVYGPMQDLDDAVFDKMLITNVRTINTMCKMVLPGMAANGGGSVVIISSVAAIKGSVTLGAYGVTKAADAAVARALALEWGPKNIRVNAIGPGLIKTDFARALWEDPERIERINNANPLRRMGTVEEIAGTALWLASPLSGYVNGQLIIADGGQSLA